MAQLKTLIVGGNFDREGGRPSKIIGAIGTATGWQTINGGDLSQLEKIDFMAVDVLLWAPNIDNSEAKFLPEIKSKNPKLTLISTKRVVEKSYSDFDVVSRLLKSRSNLGIKTWKVGDRYYFKLLDPLGNCFCETSEVAELAVALQARVAEVRSLSRIGSVSIGQFPDAEKPAVEAEFVEIVRALGDEFSRHVNAINPERFLGNASARPTDRITRCCHGFPSWRAAGDKALYLVSRRNVNKETLAADDFIVITGNEQKVEYFGETKPSVDSPIQIRLFNFYKNVQYMVHGHVYVDGAPTTHARIPCGHMEEFDEIRSLFPDPESGNFVVNLKGHGCLVLAADLDFLKKQGFHSRPFPEK